jgi:hypothetical protein
MFTDLSVSPLWIDGTVAVDAGYSMSLEAAVLPVVQAQVFTDEIWCPKIVRNSWALASLSRSVFIHF